VRLALIQFNPTIGDLRGNADSIAGWIGRAQSAGADLVVFPELALTGYPPKDLLLQEGFLEDVRDTARALADRVGEKTTALIGAPWKPPPGDPMPTPRDAFDPSARTTNSVLVMKRGRIVARYDKQLLPTYDVFDEDRYFRAGHDPLVLEVGNLRVGLALCEDLWRGADVGASGRYENHSDPVMAMVRAGARVIVSMSGSPFVLGKGARQREILTRHVVAHNIALAAVNQVGGNDDLIFDGHAAVYVPVQVVTGEGRVITESRLVAAGDGFVEQMVTADLAPEETSWWKLPAVPDPLLGAPREELLWKALVLGVRDYCRKTGFKSGAIGLSGGIDSAVTACIVAAALGAENVLGVGMPARFSSPGSVSDAETLARALGVRWALVPIEAMHGAAEKTLGMLFTALDQPLEPGVAEENVQSRIRGLILMAISNKTGALLLTTGNKSELAVGYCTIYGDMNGGLAVLSDVSKIDVYRLARWINANPGACGFAAPPIPEATITKPPSAELRPNQTDQDTLPPYDQLDRIIEAYVEQRRSASSIVRETGFPADLVRRIVRMIDVAEYKRYQMPVGLKVTGLTFGPGRRWPIAQGYRAG